MLSVPLTCVCVCGRLAVVGSYLVRRSQRDRTTVLSVVGERGAFLHYRIEQDAQGQWRMLDVATTAIPFASLDALLAHYKSAEAVATRSGPVVALTCVCAPP